MTACVTQLEGAMIAVQQEYPMMLIMSKVKKCLRVCLFHEFYNPLHDSMHYSYDDMRMMHPQHMAADHKAALEQED